MVSTVLSTPFKMFGPLFSIHEDQKFDPES